jgi:hypothetical protein
MPVKLAATNEGIFARNRRAEARIFAILRRFGAYMGLSFIFLQNFWP